MRLGIGINPPRRHHKKLGAFTAQLAVWNSVGLAVEIPDSGKTHPPAFYAIEVNEQLFIKLPRSSHPSRAAAKLTTYGILGRENSTRTGSPVSVLILMGKPGAEKSSDIKSLGGRDLALGGQSNGVG